MPAETDRTLRYEGGPDVDTLRSAYQEAVNELHFYFEQTRQAYDDRRNLWPGKSSDMRKHGSNPFPWEGASDTEAQIVNEKINTYAAILVGALKRANIRAYPVEVGDARRAKVMSAFFKWMRSNYIRDFYKQAERAANYWLEKGLMISHVGWESTERSFLQEVSLDQIAADSPEFAEMILDEGNEDQIASYLQEVFPSMKRGRARRVIRQLRNKGSAEIPFSRQTVNRPTVETCSPDGDVFFPSWCIDPQRSPFVFWRTFMTAQEVENAVATKGWDPAWAGYVIEHLRGVDTSELESQYTARNTSPLGRYTERESDLIEVVYAYQRLIDEDDGAEGIYLTVFCPKGGAATAGKPDHAVYELLSGLDEYPFVVTRLTEDQKRIYDLQTFADLFRGTQMQVKTERDQRIDRASMATLPPIMHPPGRRPDDYGPGRFIPERREGEVRFGPTPPFDQGSMEIENTLIQQSNKVVGLDPEDPDGTVKKQFYIDKFLEHFAAVLKMAYKAHTRYGPDRLVFRVTGYAEEQALQKDMFDADFDLTVSYDVLTNDPDSVEKRLGQFVQLATFDQTGKMDRDTFVEVLAGSIDPVMADAFIQSKEESVQKVLEDVTDRLAKAYAGIDIGAGQGGAQVALQAIQQYAQEPDVAQRLSQDEAFAQRIENIAKQYQFQMQQAENAQIGKIGSVPATFQGVQ